MVGIRREGAAQVRGRALGPGGEELLDAGLILAAAGGAGPRGLVRRQHRPEGVLLADDAGELRQGIVPDMGLRGVMGRGLCLRELPLDLVQIDREARLH